MNRIIFTLLLLFSVNFMSAADKKFIIYYSDKASFSKFENYSTVVFDSDNHPEIKPLTGKGIDVLGYISVGEINRNRCYFGRFRDAGVLIDPNKNWEGAYVADIRNRQWSDFILSELVPALIRKGFNGVFVDTLDSVIYLEETNPVKYKGMKEASLHLLMAIKHNYPEMKVMVNRAYEILPDSAGHIDMELAEDLYSQYNFDKKKYEFVTKEENEYQLNILKKAREKNNGLEIYSLDYWDAGDIKTIRKIYDIERKQGFIPYVSTVDLDEIINE